MPLIICGNLIKLVNRRVGTAVFTSGSLSVTATTSYAKPSTTSGFSILIVLLSDHFLLTGKVNFKPHLLEIPFHSRLAIRHFCKFKVFVCSAVKVDHTVRGLSSSLHDSSIKENHRCTFAVREPLPLKCSKSFFLIRTEIRFVNLTNSDSSTLIVKLSQKWFGILVWKWGKWHWADEMNRWGVTSLSLLRLMAFVSSWLMSPFVYLPLSQLTLWNLSNTLQTSAWLVEQKVSITQTWRQPPGHCSVSSPPLLQRAFIVLGCSHL